MDPELKNVLSRKGSIDLDPQKHQQYLYKLSNTQLDILVIGGGITGAGIALDAASRGLKVGLVEKGEFASGTSSKSTKLIHGGLRYLKTFDFGLVKSYGMERAILYNNAPHLIKKEKMLLPIVKNGSLGKFTTSLGLKMYDWLAGVDPAEKRIMLSKEETLKTEPLLNSEIVEGGGFYYEYRTDDAQLVKAVMKTATQFGATAVDQVKVIQFTYDNKKINGVVVLCQRSKSNHVIKATCVINATGPWCDKVRSLDGKLNKNKLHLTKGVHIVVEKQKLPLKQSIYFDAFDGRMIFAIPREKDVYIGTTDTTYHGDLDNVPCEDQDEHYLLNAVNFMFPSVNLQSANVIDQWAGLRPLVQDEGKDPTEISRKDEIFISNSGLISMAGGKLTGYRKMAIKAVNEYYRQMGIKRVHSFTDQIALYTK